VQSDVNQPSRKNSVTVKDRYHRRVPWQHLTYDDVDKMFRARDGSDITTGSNERVCVKFKNAGHLIFAQVKQLTVPGGAQCS
jgi:hypothetical protein